jgi:RNA polymerase sigma-70 factor, ECF subfamily
VRVSAPERTDARLLAEIAAGDPGALEVLYNRHARWIVQRLARRCADTDLCDTALQETFVSVWRSAGRFRDTSNGDAGSWLWSIAQRRLIDQLRRRRHPQTAQLPDELVADELPPPGSRAHDLLSRLPADLHGVTRAVYLDELTTKEAAVWLGIPEGTVKSRLSRARQLLQEHR